jgi:hypothetical protein
VPENVLVKMSLMDLQLIADALVEARMPCSEQDCFQCCNLAEIERRIREALAP